MSPFGASLYKFEISYISFMIRVAEQTKNISNYFLQKRLQKRGKICLLIYRVTFRALYEKVTTYCTLNRAVGSQENLVVAGGGANNYRDVHVLLVGKLCG